MTEAHPSAAVPGSRSKLGVVLEHRDGPMMESRTVAVVLNFRTASDTVQAVQTLTASRSPVAATIVVDNASRDGSVATLRAKLRDAHLVEAEQNEGFAAGCNRGIREAMRLGADRVLLLNSDARVQPDALGALELALDQNPHVGIVGPRVVERADPGVVQSLGMRYTLTTGRMRHHGFGRRYDALTTPALREVDGVSGCAMLVRRAVFEQVGLFFEDYFFGFEDLDLCLRARAAGFGTACVGSSVVAHEGSASIGRASPQRIYYATRNHLLLAARISPLGPPVSHWIRTASIVVLNLVFVLTRSEVPRREGLSAFRRALADHRARRYGRGQKSPMREGRYRCRVIPVHQLTREPGSGSRWRASGGDPQFELKFSRRRLAPGRYRLDLRTTDSVSIWKEAILYVDEGAGFSESLRVPLLCAPGVPGLLGAEFETLRPVQRLRLDPRTTPGHFQLSGADVVLLELFEQERSALAALRAFTRKAVQHPRSAAVDLRAGLATLFVEGPAALIRTMRRPDERPTSYGAWIQRYDTLTPEDIRHIAVRISEMNDRPLISVLMPVHNAPPQYLRRAIDSVRAQLYDRWELCIADDGSTNPATLAVLESYASDDSRIRMIFRETNGHISAASNSALTLVTGSYVALMDHDDEIPQHALYVVADAITTNPHADIVYSDEDKIDAQGNRFDPYFKCAWNRGLFYSQNLINHLGVYRTDLVRKVGGFREGYEGSQDYDLALRCLEQSSPDRIVHLPFVLYHWRAIPGSTAVSVAEKDYAATAALRALNDHFRRLDYSGEVVSSPTHGFNRVCFRLPTPPPLVSVIIPTRDAPDLLATCVRSVLEKTTYPALEILIVDNGTTDATALSHLEQFRLDPRVRLLKCEQPFNYSAINNLAVRASTGRMLCLLNNDVEVITPSWLEEMVSWAASRGIGAVGAKLLYPDGTIQHAGVTMGILGVAGHSFRRRTSTDCGYFGRAVVGQDVSAITGACLVVGREAFEAVGGFNERELTVAFNDIDLCLRLKKAGYRNYWTPYAVLCHQESASRGPEDSVEKQRRFQLEIAYMKRTWDAEIRDDPAYSPNLTLLKEDYSLAFPPRVMKPWRRPAIRKFVNS